MPDALRGVRVYVRIPGSKVNSVILSSNDVKARGDDIIKLVKGGLRILWCSVVQSVDLAR